MIPTLHTKRLTLRPYERRDFDIYATFLGSDRAIYMDGPVDADKAWTWFTNDIATWALFGFGSLAVEFDGKLAGSAGLTFPPHFPEPECGWFIYNGFTGLGIASEAGRAILDHTFATTDLQSIVSYIDENNIASIRVAKKLGGVLDPHAASPDEAGTVVYRYTRGAT